MRKYMIAALVLLLCTSAAVQAGVPDPARSGCQLKGQGASCQYRFNAAGGLDCLSVCVTLRDIFDVPVPDCSTSATINNLGAAFCSCCPQPQTGTTDSTGVVVFEFKKIGGRGTAEVCITAHCVGDIGICCETFDFTSPDLDADCVDTDVIDLGIWAACLPPGPYCRESDFNCDGTVGVIDLGIFASGLGTDCSSGIPCP